jgi:hypothetical protein
VVAGFGVGEIGVHVQAQIGDDQAKYSARLQDLVRISESRENEITREVLQDVAAIKTAR